MKYLKQKDMYHTSLCKWGIWELQRVVTRGLYTTFPCSFEPRLGCQIKKVVLFHGQEDFRIKLAEFEIWIPTWSLSLGSAPLIQCSWAWNIDWHSKSLKNFMGGCFWLCYLKNMINVSYGFCRQWVEVQTVQNSRQLDQF